MAPKQHTATLEEVVTAGGGRLIRIATGMVYFADPEHDGLLLLPIPLATPKRVSQSISDRRKKRACAERN